MLSNLVLGSALLGEWEPRGARECGQLAAAFSGVCLLPFTAATALGVLPRTAHTRSREPRSPALLLPTADTVVMTLLTLVSLWRARPTFIPRNADEAV
ncbi:hypothetical protein GCM10018777_10980 [Streptomyces albogriseolus]|nr:hypothetical protein GCM10018777_10980 [Streptomyces viridodiastaticus]